MKIYISSHPRVSKDEYPNISFAAGKDCTVPG